MKTIFYVYEWYIKDTNEIIYVGKGCRNRYKVKKHNKFFNEMIKRFDCDSRIIKTFESEKDAFLYEYERVKELKTIGQCCCNIYDGGMGGTVDWWTEERREWYSANNAMRDQKQRERMSKNNPMKNEAISKKVGEKHSRQVIINGVEYKKVRDAARKYNVCEPTIRKWCQKGKNPLGENCRYKDEEQVVFVGKRYNKCGCKTVLYLNKKYESPLDLAEELNVKPSTIYSWCRRGFDKEGNSCRYENDNRELVFNTFSIGEKNKKPIKVNGIIYPSKADAEKTLGLKKGALAPYIAGRRNNKKFICEYVNQQPSHTNTEFSSVEGSTTNE